MVTGIDRESMEKFTNDNVSNVMLGGEASFALGPVGRTATGEAYVAATGPSSNSEAYMSYSQSRGAYGGVTVDAAYVSVRKDVNEKFYGYAVSARDILGGKVDRPKAAEPLYSALSAFYATVFPARGHGTGGYDQNGRLPRHTYAGGTGYVDRQSVGSHQAYATPSQNPYEDEFGRPRQPGYVPPQQHPQQHPQQVTPKDGLCTRQTKACPSKKRGHVLHAIGQASKLLRHLSNSECGRTERALLVPSREQQKTTS